ncbi:dehydrodolichyl diphosphate synthase complex subunit DHDDS-like [Rhipicephalus microplus]|uniref:dehydrodolichyl diphosphate synthase complex subunit DHDDS-like n=1 Tax=Rhipicephalus microplus TaxID=6941 RepID=UPI003F6CDC9B
MKDTVGPYRATVESNSDAPSVSDIAKTSEKGWDSQLSWYERIMLWVLRQGTIPRHFTILADGNRRFSRKKKMSLSQVYSLMFRKFTTTWPYMAALGVPEVTYFMISTRNFSRNTWDLVTAIDEMMKFFTRTLQCLNIFRKIGLSVTAVGNLDLLPNEMREKIAQTEVSSDDESPAAKLSLCVAYNTKVGLKNMVLNLISAAQAGAIESDDITAGFLAEWLTVSDTPETELWFRSSGEMRFSEFLVLQSGYSYIHIDPQLWPAITFRNWIWAVLQFQLIVRTSRPLRTVIATCGHLTKTGMAAQLLFLRSPS